METQILEDMEPTAADLAGMVADDIELMNDADNMASALHAALESQHVERAARAAVLAARRAELATEPGATAVLYATRELNVTRRRRTAVAVIGGNHSPRIDSSEATVAMLHGNDIDRAFTVNFPLARIDDMGTVTVWPVRLTGRVSAVIDETITHVFRAAELATVEPNIHAFGVAFERAIERADKVRRSYSPRRLEWDGTETGLVELITEHAPHRAGHVADRARAELKLRRAHKARRAATKAANDDRAADLVTLLSSVHVTADGVYSALVPNGDTGYALAIIDGRAIGEYLGRTLTAGERKVIQRKREELTTGNIRPRRGESSALANLMEDIKRRASRSR